MATLTRFDLLRLVAEEACRDGVLEDREKRLLEVLVEFLRIDRVDALAIVDAARKAFAAGQLGPPRAMDERSLYRAVLDAVHADGVVDRIEQKMLEAVRRLLGILPAVHQQLFEELGLLARKKPRVVLGPIAPAPPPPPPVLDEVRALFDQAAALPPSKLGLPELEAAEQPLRAACAALAPKLAALVLPPVEAMSAHGALFRVMTRVGSAIADARAAGERAKAAHDTFPDVTTDGDPVQRLIAQGWVARANNLSEAGLPERARALVNELLKQLDDRWVTCDLRLTLAGFSPPRRELDSTTTLTTAGLGALLTGVVMVVGGGNPFAAGTVAVAGAGLLTLGGATARFDNDGITLASRLGERHIRWNRLATVAFGSVDRYRRGRHGPARYYGTDVYIDLVAEDGTAMSLNGMDSERQGGPWMTTVDQLQAYVQPRLWARDQARFRERGELRFGALTLSTQGLRFRRLRGFGPQRELAWADLKTADFDGDRLRLYAHGDLVASFSASSRSLPNLFSLFALMDQHGHAVG